METAVRRRVKLQYACFITLRKKLESNLAILAKSVEELFCLSAPKCNRRIKRGNTAFNGAFITNVIKISASAGIQKRVLVWAMIDTSHQNKLDHLFIESDPPLCVNSETATKKVVVASRVRHRGSLLIITWEEKAKLSHRLSHIQPARIPTRILSIGCRDSSSRARFARLSLSHSSRLDLHCIELCRHCVRSSTRVQVLLSILLVTRCVVVIYRLHAPLTPV